MSDDPENVISGLEGLFVTAAVTEPEPVADPVVDVSTQVVAVVPSQVPAAQMPDGWTLQKVAALVNDLAQNLYDEEYTIKKHGLSPEHYALLMQNENFVRMLEADRKDWHRSDNVQKRLALKAALLVEASLPDVGARMAKPTEPLADVVALVKVLLDAAGVIGTKAANAPQAPGEKFKIIINMGADTIVREATRGPLVSVEGSGSTLQSIEQAPGVPAKI